ncbi:hypothetical protein [Urechidicola vernalis]|uniref:Lipoprotein n=1 Tax=Urechidicola vernalis TaxID=3075600 RepID=A0ABU2Y166_9FLAO|nr:hypothetical protein [Urechidicola sp. P050]MDT0551885.1 hypothetical protein [Urechidicola sp. P050]
MKKQFFLISALVLLCIVSCKKENKVGGPCTYVDLEMEVKITLLDGDLNEDFMISMQPNVEDPGNEVYRLSKKQLNNMEINFEFEALKSKENVYVLTEKKITEGTCTPIIISKMHLKK